MTAITIVVTYGLGADPLRQVYRAEHLDWAPTQQVELACRIVAELDPDGARRDLTTGVITAGYRAHVSNRECAAEVAASFAAMPAWRGVEW